MACPLRARGPGGSRRLVYLISRYGGAIEADLAALGWDLAALWRYRRWRFLLNLIEHLPRTSHFVAAMADDEELAEQLPEPQGESHPPLTEYSPVVERLDLVVDRLGEVVTAVVNTVAKKPRKPPRAQRRPQTARERLKLKRRKAKHALLLKRLAQAHEAGRPTMADAPPDHRFMADVPRRRQE